MAESCVINGAYGTPKHPSKNLLDIGGFHHSHLYNPSVRSKHVS